MLLRCTVLCLITGRGRVDAKGNWQKTLLVTNATRVLGQELLDSCSLKWRLQWIFSPFSWLEQESPFHVLGQVPIGQQDELVYHLEVDRALQKCVVHSEYYVWNQATKKSHSFSPLCFQGKGFEYKHKFLSVPSTAFLFGPHSICSAVHTNIAARSVFFSTCLFLLPLQNPVFNNLLMFSLYSDKGPICSEDM